MKNNKNRIKEYKNCDFKIEELEDRLELGAWIGGDGGDGGDGGNGCCYNAQCDCGGGNTGGDGGEGGDGGKGNTGVETIKK